MLSVFCIPLALGWKVSGIASMQYIFNDLGKKAFGIASVQLRL